MKKIFLFGVAKIIAFEVTAVAQDVVMFLTYFNKSL